MSHISPIVVPENAPSLDTPSLEGLAYLLRHPERWPAGFEWSFYACNTCAMGLAVQVWCDAASRPFVDWIDFMCDNFGISYNTARDIFTRPGSVTPVREGEGNIPPRYVARAIDTYLEMKEWGMDVPFSPPTFSGITSIDFGCPISPVVPGTYSYTPTGRLRYTPPDAERLSQLCCLISFAADDNPFLSDINPQLSAYRNAFAATEPLPEPARVAELV